MSTELTETKGAVLLVDDLPENLQLLSDLLSQMGYTTRSVTSGKMALKTLKVKQPDVIFLDIKMPDMDGYEVCKVIKSDSELKNIPILFISALDDAFDKVKAFECGGVDYITKPFQIEEVVARLENQLTIQRQKNALHAEVTRRRETEEALYQSRALLSSVLNSSLDGIAALQSVRDPQTGDICDFRCLVVNPVISKAFDSNREDLIGKLVIKKFLKRLQSDLFQQFVDVVEAGDSLEKDFYYQSSWYHFIAVKLGDGFAISVRDITSRKQMEIDLQEANRKLELLANSDGLTHIANRRSFNDYLFREWKRHEQEQQPIALILLDIDYFKRYNDYYGHQEGDDCLIKVAQTIAELCQRPTDFVARYGGEEFAIILPHTDANYAFLIAESIRETIAALNLPHAGSLGKPFITLSLGVATVIPNAENDLDALITQADIALYEAKNKGRNQTIVFK